MAWELISDCYVLLGAWEKEVCENQKLLNKDEYERIITFFWKATESNPVNISAWHYFAMLNYESAN